jgi:alkylation response protein AidB-like acyl-CoA dehydrogenase
MSEAAGIAPFGEDRLDAIRMIRDSASAFAGTARARRLRFTLPGFEPEVWREMASLGWIGLAVPEASGGAGLGMAEMCALAEELGGALAPEPLIPCALSADLLAAAGERDLLAALLAGEAVVLTAWQDRAGTIEPCLDPAATRRFVPMAAGATHFLLPSTEGLHLLPRDAVELTTEFTQDGGHVGRLRPLAVCRRLPLSGLAEALDRAALATSAYLLGGMEAAFALTLEHLRMREQFGRKIGSFQALQHRAADARLLLSLTRASVEQAAADPSPALCSKAKARASDAALKLQASCLQMLGGIGYTDDHDSGLYHRKAMVLVPLFGGAALHRRRFQALAPELEDA